VQRQGKKKTILGNSDGIAVVEAAILYPLMFMLFSALVMIAIYIPQRALLQRAVQFGADSFATEIGDAWIRYEYKTMTYERFYSYDEMVHYKGRPEAGLHRVHYNNVPDRIQRTIFMELTSVAVSIYLDLDIGVVNHGVFKQVVVTGVMKYHLPINLSFIGFPNPFTMVATATAEVVNGDEFIRQVNRLLIER